MDSAQFWIGAISGLIVTGVPAVIALLKIVHNNRMQKDDQDAKIRKSDAEIGNTVFSQMTQYISRLLVDNSEKQKLIDELVERDRQRQGYEAKLIAIANRYEERDAWLQAELEEATGRKLDIKPMPSIPELPQFDETPAFRAKGSAQNMKLLEALNPIPDSIHPKSGQHPAQPQQPDPQI